MNSCPRCERSTPAGIWCDCPTFTETFNCTPVAGDPLTSFRGECKHDWVGDDHCAYCRVEELEFELSEMRQQRDKAEYDRTYAIGGIKTLLRELSEDES